MRVLSFLREYRLESALFVVLVAFCAIWDFQLIYSTIAVTLFLIVVFGINDTLISRGIGSGIVDIRSRPLFLVFTLVMLVFFLILGITYETAAFLVAFLVFALYAWDYRIFAVCTVLALTGCIVLLILDIQSVAEQMAICAYYFLVMTIMLQFIEYGRNRIEYA